MVYTVGPSGEKIQHIILCYTTQLRISLYLIKTILI